MLHRILSREEMEDANYSSQSNDVPADLSTAERDLLLNTIKERVPAQGRIVEWGSGGSTVLIADYKPRDAQFISVEHNKRWYDKIIKFVFDNPSIEYLFVPADGPFSAYGKIEEEDPTYLTKYIFTPENIKNTDIFFVDGVARNSILNRIFQEAKIGAYVLLHDGYRDWYNDGMSHFKKIIQVESLILSIKETK